MRKKYGKEIWEKALEKAGLDKDMTVIPTQSVSDGIVLGLVNSLCEIKGISLSELADTFGDYWVNVYSQRIYKTFYDEANNAKDFLLKMDSVHRIMTKKRKSLIRIESPNLIKPLLFNNSRIKG
ncbi:hypothetical protein DRP07_09345 [Archaeoglobales archaeon]|nr:MAG: hypothetical protein DRP07_09345 [Archaeoglobales archaeon]